MRQLTFAGVFPTIQANTNPCLLGGSKSRIKSIFRHSGVTMRASEHPRLRPAVRRGLTRTGVLRGITDYRAYHEIFRVP